MVDPTMIDSASAFRSPSRRSSTGCVAGVDHVATMVKQRSQAFVSSPRGWTLSKNIPSFMFPR